MSSYHSDCYQNYLRDYDVDSFLEISDLLHFCVLKNPNVKNDYLALLISLVLVSPNSSPFDSQHFEL